VNKLSRDLAALPWQLADIWTRVGQAIRNAATALLERDVGLSRAATSKCTITKALGVNPLQPLRHVPEFEVGPDESPDDVGESLVRLCAAQRDPKLFWKGGPELEHECQRLADGAWLVRVRATYLAGCPVGSRFMRSAPKLSGAASLPTTRIILEGRIEPASAGIQPL